MKEWLFGLWSNEAKFRAAVRAGVALAGVIVTQIPSAPPWVGLAIIAAANLIAAGQRNPPAEPGASGN